MGPAPTFLLEIKKTQRLVQESMHVKVIACNGAKAVLDTASCQCHFRDACYA
jgi:glutamate racemase